MKEKVLDIIYHYGVIPQQKKFAEEFFELEEAMMSYEKCHIYAPNGTISDEYEQCMKNHIAEEMADLVVMFEQFRNFYNISLDSIEEIALKKIDRQIERIKNEEN